MQANFAFFSKLKGIGEQVTHNLNHAMTITHNILWNIIIHRNVQFDLLILGKWAKIVPCKF
ncbi:hypothetical protein D3C75_1160120 [compost metagenome]